MFGPSLSLLLAISVKSTQTMANKRTSRKRQKRRTSPRPAVRQPVSKTMEMGPVQIVQQGTYIGIRTDPEHPEYEAYMEMQHKMDAELPEHLLSLRSELVDTMAPHNAFDVIFGVWSFFGRASASTLRPLADEGLATTAEFIAHALLDRTSPDPTREPSPEEMRSGPNPYELGKQVADIVGFLPILFTHRQLGEDGNLDPWLELRSRLYMHRLGIRSFTYEDQERATLRELFDSFADELRDTCGYTAEQGLALAQGIAELPMIGASERARRARAEAEKLRQIITARRNGKRASSDYPDALIDWLLTLSPRDAEQSIVAMTASWSWHACGRDAAFTPKELADHVNVPLDAAQSFLDVFSVIFGQREDQERWDENPSRALEGAMEVMRERPIVYDGRDHYLPSGVDSVFFGVRDRLTDALKSKPTTWERFQAHRAQTIEHRALSALEAALKADWAHGPVKYKLLSPDGSEVEGEADGVLRADSLIVLIEVKSGALAPSARRTAPHRLERGLRDLVNAAAVQLARDEKALLDGQATHITDQCGHPLVIDTQGLLRVLRIVVTLEDLSGVAPAAWRLQEAGLLPADEHVPWVVGIHELELICELVERPAQLVHYILRRERANRQRIWGMDEMDFFMHYLQRGLVWRDDELRDTYLEIQNHSDPLDAWWFGERGIHAPAPKPRQRMNAATRRLLDDIEVTGSQGRLEAQVMILETSTRERERIASGFRKLLRMTAHDGLPHDMTMVFGQDFAITLHSNPATLRAVAAARLRDHGIKRSDRSNLRRWLGLATVAGNSGRLSDMAILVDPHRLGNEEPDRPARH
jgi:hypothetical protein